MRTASRLLLRALCGRRPALRSPQVNPGTSTSTRYKIQEQQQHKNNSVPEQYKREKQEQHTSQYTTLLIQE